MNIKNNKRRRESRDRIEKVFIDMLRTKELNQISVSDICKEATLNRTTFYANYEDIYALADSVRELLEAQTTNVNNGKSSDENYTHDYYQLFHHIYENQAFYQAYFKLGYDNQYKIICYDVERAKKEFNGKFINYHCEFFRSGLTAIIKMWLAGGCKETPDEMYEIITSEYKGRMNE